jgi:predicted nucleic acid-binding protein
MTRVFVDTSSFVALLCEKDEYHGVAGDTMEDFPRPLVTTIWILAVYRARFLGHRFA